jgi:hypothetical protein
MVDGVVQAGEDQGLLSELRETCFESWMII